MKELDVLLERFARAVLPTAPPSSGPLFARFLELPDPVLVDYLLGQRERPPSPSLPPWSGASLDSLQAGSTLWQSPHPSGMIRRQRGPLESRPDC